jgi:hypothetical protein
VPDRLAIFNCVEDLSGKWFRTDSRLGDVADGEARPRLVQFVPQGGLCGVRELSELITTLAARQMELGLSEPGESETSPRQIVSKALTYLQNQQDKMRYPENRKLGLPITSSHMESAIKELNYRLKGTEKFWSEGARERGGATGLPRPRLGT